MGEFCELSDSFMSTLDECVSPCSASPMVKNVKMSENVSDFGKCVDSELSLKITETRW